MKREEATAFKDQAQWHAWLTRNHDSCDELWLLIYKKAADDVGIRYEEALEEAICFGWIDGKLRRIDDRCHAIRFTPRRPGGIWSENNRRRAERMIKEGRMQKPGLQRIEEARKNGQWAAARAPKTVPPMPPDLKSALRANTKASRNFASFADSYKSAYIHWIIDAKKQDTRAKRVRTVVSRAEANKRPGT